MVKKASFVYFLRMILDTLILMGSFNRLLMLSP